MKLTYFSVCILSTIGCFNSAFSAEENSLGANNDKIITDGQKLAVINNDNNDLLKNKNISKKYTDIKKIILPPGILHHIISFLDRDYNSLFTLMNFSLVNKNLRSALLSAPVYLSLSAHMGPGFNITDKQVCKLVQLFPRTRSVTIDFGNVTYKILTYLASLPHLTTLHLKYLKVDDDALSLLTQFKNLTEFSLTKCKEINDLSFLKGITNLTALDLSGITIASNPNNLKFLGSLTQLKSLDLSHLIRPFANDPIEWPDHKKELVSANLNQNLRQLSPLTNLNRLNLTGNPIKDNTLELFSFLPNLTDLNLEDTKLTGTDLSFLKYLKKLRYLNLADIRVKDNVLSPLNGLASLTYLNLRKAEITHKGLEQITHLITLTDLDLSAVVTIPSDELRMMYCFTNLTTLNLACCTQIVDSDLMVLGNLKKLKWLDLYKIPNISFDIRSELKRELPDLRIIYH